MPFIVTIDRRSFLLGSAIALGMALLLMSVGTGSRLAAAQMPGLACAWLVFLWMYRRGAELPSAGDVLPVYFTAMALHLIQFAEQFVAGFPERFARLHGGLPFDDDQFVAITMVSAAVFTLTGLAVYLRAATFLMVPVLFFAINTIYGTAFSETWWSFEVGGYFPGLVTALANWLIGPILIGIVVQNFQTAASVMIGLGVAQGLVLALLRA